MCKQSNSYDPMTLTCYILVRVPTCFSYNSSSSRAARVLISEYLAVFSVQTEVGEKVWERQHASKEKAIDAHFFFSSMYRKCLFTTIPRTKSVLFQARQTEVASLSCTKPFIAATAQSEGIKLGFYLTNFCLGLQAFLWHFQLLGGDVLIFKFRYFW